MIRRILKIFAFVIAALGILALAMVGPIDRSPVPDRPFYKEMMSRLDTLNPPSFRYDSALSCGWAKISITPSSPMPMAGYSPRDQFDSVHDSLFARVLLVDNGGISVAFVNVDLLLFPTILKRRINEKFDSLGTKPFLYLSATHTHNGIGGWESGIAGRLVFGTYHPEWVEKTANGIVSAINSIDLVPSSLSYWETDASNMVQNRIDRENGATDGILRGMVIERSDNSRAVLFTFSAHPTSIDKGSRALSADYPGAVIKALEATDTYDFGMFMAGMVGSHRFAWVPETDFEFIDMITPVLVKKINIKDADTTLFAEGVPVPDIKATHIPIEFGAAQPRISKNWKIRDWVVRALARPLQGEATYVEIGNIVFIGLPCDFSGEIFKRENFADVAKSAGKHVIITSFNGDYNGYITWDPHYETGTAEEVNATNWVGPGYGKYFAEIVRSLIVQDSSRDTKHK